MSDATARQGFDCKRCGDTKAIIGPLGTAIPCPDCRGRKLAQLDHALGERVIEPGELSENTGQLKFSDRRSIATAPKDGSNITVPVQWNLQAYWCKDLKRWILTRPLHVESIDPEYWIPPK